MTKFCHGCERELPVEEFHKNRRRKDGLQTQCKFCIEQYRRQRLENPEARERQYEAQREWCRRNRPRIRERVRGYNARNRDKERARQRVKHALKMGRLTKPDHCDLCGETGRIEGHHADYAKPLEVQWLCSQCHHDVHKSLVRAARA